MNKLKEILFLKNLPGVGKATIYKTYWGMLNDNDAFLDLVSDVELTNRFSTEEIKKAMFESENLYDNLFNSDIHTITVFDSDYPKKLHIMGNKRPLILYVKGNIDALSKPNIAVIGTRKPSKNSQEFETNLVKRIVNNTDRVVVSGLALGCDKIAHKTTVDEDKITVAVLPSGVNVIKPAKHKKLAQDIIDKGGCLVSEYEPNTNVNRGSYVERDAIVAAFSDAIFVVECGIKSGTMHTVDFTSEYGKQIFSYLPENRPKGSYDGNEYILRNNENAMEVEDIDEFLDNLGNLNPKKKSGSVQMTFDNL